MRLLRTVFKREGLRIGGLHGVIDIYIVYVVLFGTSSLIYNAIYALLRNER